MKNTVIQFFQNLPKEKYEQFNQAFELYRKSEGKSLGMEKGINAAGFSEHTLNNLLYDLQKLHGITDVEKVPSIQLAVVSDQSAGEIESAKWDSLDPEIANLFQTLLAMSFDERNAWGIDRQKQFGDFDELLQLSFRSGIEEVSDCLTNVWGYLSEPDLTNKNQDLKATEGTRPDDSHPGTASTEAIDTNTEASVTTTEPAMNEDLVDAVQYGVEGLKTNNEFGMDFGMLKQENEDLQDEKADLEDELEATAEENESLKDKLDKLKSLPKIDAKSIRVEFPFLSEPNCPDEFKILVADKITAWNDYLQCHETLRSIDAGELVTDDASKAEIAKAAIASFDENQKIYDELVAYAESGKVLGVHPIFKKLQLTREVEEMTADELHKYKGSSAKYFTVNKKAFAEAVKAKNEDRMREIDIRVAEREAKLSLVNKKLGINPK